MAVRHVQLTEQIQQLAIRQERGRISQEIHDGISQLISAIRIRAETAELAMEDGDEGGVKETLEDIKRVADDAVASLRDEIIGLREGMQRDKSFAALLVEVLDRYQRQWGIVASFEQVGDKEDWALAPQVELQLLRVVQEAIANVRRHANATRVLLILRRHGNDLLLEIQDDGQGFDPSQVQVGQMGLRIMRERVESIGGEFILDSKQSMGTNLTVKIPSRIALEFPRGIVNVYGSLSR